jgi:hypothetical protein
MTIRCAVELILDPNNAQTISRSTIAVLLSRLGRPPPTGGNSVDGLNSARNSGPNYRSPKTMDSYHFSLRDEPP